MTHRVSYSTGATPPWGIVNHAGRVVARAYTEGDAEKVRDALDAAPVAREPIGYLHPVDVQNAINGRGGRVWLSVVPGDGSDKKHPVYR